MHKSAVPLAGGAGMIAAFLLLLVFFGGQGGARPFPLALFCFLCGIYGVFDDKFALPAAAKLSFQLFIGAFASLALGRIEAFSAFGYTVPLGVLSVPATALWVAFMMNAVNLTDGMDGLCAGTSAVSAACLSLLLFSHVEGMYAVFAAALSGVCLGFLFHNRAPAKIFMGETGSAFIGFALAVLSLPLFLRGVGAPLAAVLPAVLFPLCEAAGSFLRRALKGKNPFAPDKSHMHHVLFARGLCVPLVCAAEYTFALLCAFCALTYSTHRVLSLALFTVAVVFMRLLLAKKRK
jgi:UDP-GlcNAc:undecaprenyl-phosphate GlcNAc-1-phosphate transferase